MAAATAKPPSGSRRGLVQRFTGKAGPLPVWAWALLILAVGYLIYRIAGKGTTSSSSSPAAAPADTTGQVSGDTSGSPPASGQGGAADNVNADMLAQLSGLQGSVDSLTGLIQSLPAFPDGGGAAGSGSTVPNSGGGDFQPMPWEPGGSTPIAPRPMVPSSTVTRPTARPPAPAHVKFYSYQPGRAPAGQKRNEAPARGPAGTTLHFARGKGYYYA